MTKKNRYSIDTILKTAEQCNTILFLADRKRGHLAWCPLTIIVGDTVKMSLVVVV